MHNNQLEVSTATVRRLVSEQFPKLADEPIEELTTEGTVHAIFKVGSSVAARFPLQYGDPQVVQARLILGKHGLFSSPLGWCGITKKEIHP